MGILEELSEHDKEIFLSYLKEEAYSQEDVIVPMGVDQDKLYIIDEGIVRLEVDEDQFDDDGILAYCNPGDIIGKMQFIEDAPSPYYAYADTDVKIRSLSLNDFEHLSKAHPKTALAVSVALLKAISREKQKMVLQLSEFILSGEVDAATEEMVRRAVAAQAEFETWEEERIEKLLADIAQEITAHAEELAADTVNETGMGNVQDKITKIKLGSTGIYENIKGKKSVGLLSSDETTGVMEFAHPVGTILGIIPCTNPVPTISFKVLISLKGKNALIYSSHRRALQVGNKAGDLIRKVLKKHGASPDLVQFIRERTSRKKTNMLWNHPDVKMILATGGPSLVKSAYASGKPAIGVGEGNAPIYIAKDANYRVAAQMVVQSKSFDYGILCVSENNIVADTSIYEPLLSSFAEAGAAVVSSEEKELILANMFDSKGKLLIDYIGKSAEHILRSVGIARSQPVKLIVVPISKEEIDGPLAHEKMTSMVSLIRTDGEDEALDFCVRILNNQGKGHTAGLHTSNEELIRRFGAKIPASRITVNSPSSFGCIGITSNLQPSFTLGCGFMGGNSTTENVSYNHVINIKRVAKYVEK